MPVQLIAQEYAYFIGTDISKNKLDHSVFRGRTLLFHQVTNPFNEYTMHASNDKRQVISSCIW